MKEMDNTYYEKKPMLKARIISILFFCILIYPVIDQTFSITKRKKTDQAKLIVHFPSLDTNKLDSIPKLLEAYYSDKFSMQDFMVAVNSYFKIKFFGVSPNPLSVVVGKHGWLFDGERSINNYRGLDVFTTEELIKMKTILDNRGKWYRSKGIRFYFTIAPDKHSIYSEYLPSNIQKVNPQTMYDQLVELFNGDTLVPMIDLRKPIIDAKKYGYELYFKIDHHWTDIGAFYAYLEIIKRIHIDFPQIIPLELKDFSIDSSEKFVAGSESEKLNISKYYNEKRVRLVKKIPTKCHKGIKANYPVPKGFPYPDDYEVVHVVDGSTHPYAFIIRDSFADWLMQYFYENFRECKYFYDGWGYRFNKDIIEKEKPDMVILMPYESNLKRILECSDD